MTYYWQVEGEQPYKLFCLYAALQGFDKTVAALSGTGRAPNVDEVVSCTLQQPQTASCHGTSLHVLCFASATTLSPLTQMNLPTTALAMSSLFTCQLVTITAQFFVLYTLPHPSKLACLFAEIFFTPKYVWC